MTKDLKILQGSREKARKIDFVIFGTNSQVPNLAISTKIIIKFIKLVNELMRFTNYTITD